MLQDYSDAKKKKSTTRIRRRSRLSTPVAAYDESEQSDLPINNIGGIVPLTDDPTLTGPSSENDYLKIFKYSWPRVMMFLFKVIGIIVILKTFLKTVVAYQINLVGTKFQIHLSDAAWLLLPYALVSPKYFRKNTSWTGWFSNKTREILQVFIIRDNIHLQGDNIQTDNFRKTDADNDPNRKATPVKDKNLKGQSGLSNINSSAEPLDYSTTWDESNQTSIDIPGLSKQVSATNSESTYDDKQKFHKAVPKIVPFISIFFCSASAILVYRQLGQKLNLAEKIITCAAALMGMDGVLLFVHYLKMKPCARTAKLQWICILLGLLMFLLCIGIAVGVVVSPDHPVVGTIIVAVFITVVLCAGFLLFAFSQKEDNREN